MKFLKLNFLKGYTYIWILTAICILLSLSGCHYKKEKDEHSPLLKDPQFISAFQDKKIRLVAPGSGIGDNRIQELQSLKELDIDIPENLQISAKPNFEGVPYHSNLDDERFKILKNALYSDSKNDIIWSLRGGYGSARLLDDLHKLPKPKTEKIFIGFSDTTALHLFLSQKWNWKTVHGSMMLELLHSYKDPNNLQGIADIIAKKSHLFKIDNLRPLNASAKRAVKISGKLTGGNLTLVQSSLGTHWQIQAANKILFLEDEGEKGYRIDRMLHHLKQAGILNRVNGIVFGEFSESDEFADFALKRFANETKIPVYKTESFGHGKKNYPLIYNADASIVPMKPGENNDLHFQLKMTGL